VSDADRCEIPCYNPQLVDRLKERMLPEDTLQRLAGVFGLLADRTRLKIIGALADGEELCVCDVSHVVGLSLSATSHQLRRLREAGVVSYRNDGRMVYYRLADGFLAGLILQAKVKVEREVA